MLSKRIIACLDVKDGKVVKGVKFLNLVEAGNPVTIAKSYEEQGIDEIVFLDITATSDKRNILLKVVEETASQIFIPLTVGGGIRTLQDIRDLLSVGADKVSINSLAIKEPSFITKAANRFGSQCLVIAIDAKKVGESYEVYTHGGRVPTGIDAIEWAREASLRGAGEILLTSMDEDGTKLGYELELTRRISESVNIPVIASGGAGCKEHFLEVFEKGKADAALAASLFHFHELSIPSLKNYLLHKGIPIRKL